MKQATVLKKLQAARPALADRWGVRRLAVFGSFARNEQSRASDVDLLVELDDALGYFEFMDLQRYLSDLLARRVDLATPEMLHPRMKDKILQECIDAWG